MGNMLLLTQHQVAHSHFWSEKMSSCLFFGKAGEEGWGYFENLWGVYLWRCSLYYYV